MSLLPAKDKRPQVAHWGLNKGNDANETTRLLSRANSGVSTPPTRYIEVNDFDDKASSISVSTTKHFMYASRQGSVASSHARHPSDSTHRYYGRGLYKDDLESVHSQPKMLISRHGTNSTTKFTHYYGGLQKEDDASNESDSILMEIKDSGEHINGDEQVAAIIYRLFSTPHYDHQHPKTIPELTPERRGKRHRHPTLWSINQFRHWWKTSRLLVRLSGSYGWCQNMITWSLMATFDVTEKKGAKGALKQMKRIGRGGGNRVFLMNVHPFTRTLRIFIACARAWEARVDNRFYEVGIAEAMAFIGNRCFRYYARHITDWISKFIAFPISGRCIAPYLEQQSRPVIVVMGLVRAVLPFVSSYFGSAFGRKMTFAAYRAANYRWKPVQSIFHFHENQGVYQDIEGDEELLEIARDISVSLGHDSNPVNNRAALQSLGFEIVAAGSGGISSYNKQCEDARKRITLYITPYGPSILDEMPRYIIVSRRFQAFSALNLWDKSVASIFDADLPPEAEIQGFTYSGAYFTSQEWAALKNRYVDELASYNNACKIMGTPRSHIDSTKLQHNEIAYPPTDLITLKAFIKTGHTSKKRRKERRRWKQVQKSVQQLVDTLEKNKAKGSAPNGVILYFDGLDCSGKSSTGGLICDALEKSGYTVNMVQYNRPPTEEEKRKPWMDRFETPEAATETNGGNYAALVWDRGPAGDFVYGNLARLSLSNKLDRYEDFRKFDLECEQRGILFCKLLFVTDKDSIAETLGKRLAHKKIAQDLVVWLDANSVPHDRPGIDEIKLHIDPTDFVAYNNYSENLAKFCEFARNTNNVGHVGAQKYTSIGYSNPWHVICTSKRHPARLALMKSFRHQLFDFETTPEERIKVLDTSTTFFGVDKHDDEVFRPVPREIVEEREHGLSTKALIYCFFLGLLVYAYAYQTWNFKLEDIT